MAVQGGRYRETRCVDMRWAIMNAEYSQLDRALLIPN